MWWASYLKIRSLSLKLNRKSDQKSQRQLMSLALSITGPAEGYGTFLQTVLKNTYEYKA